MSESSEGRAPLDSCLLDGSNRHVVRAACDGQPAATNACPEPRRRGSGPPNKRGAQPSSVVPIYLRVAPADIAFVKFVFESYEGVGIVRTIDRHVAVIVVLAVADFLDTAREILESLQAAIPWTEVDAPPLPADDWLMREIIVGSPVEGPR